MADLLLKTGDIVIPRREIVSKPADEDPVDYYYRPLTAPLYRGRLRLAARLLGRSRRRALLDVGYGAGLFLPELGRRAERIAGVDIHPAAPAVSVMLDRLGVKADLHEASLFELPFEDGEFDALVCLSVLEHLTELDRALDEMRRVLSVGGVAVLGFPVRNAITDRFFRLAGYDPRAIHPSGHLDILRAARRHPGLHVDEEARMPSVLPLPLAAYAACRCIAC